MKKILLQLLKKYFDPILIDWQEQLTDRFAKEISEKEFGSLLKNTFSNILKIMSSTDKQINDEIIIEMYNIFTSRNLNIWHISQIFSQGKFVAITYIEKGKTSEYDPVILIGFLNEGMEEIFSRIMLLCQESLKKALNEDRKSLLHKLEINQQYLKALLYGSDSAIMIVDENEQLIAWNNGAERIFGYKEEEILGKDSSYLLPNESYHSELKKIQKEVSLKGRLKINETERKTKDGRIIPVTLNVTKLEGENNSYGGRSIIINDVTEVKTLQKQVDQSEKLAVIGQLAAGVAHEIGNPLTAISSVVQLLQRKSDEEYVNSQLSVIKENIDRISRIVRELVDFSRPPKYEETESDITDIVKTAMGIVKYDKRVKKVDFKADLASNLTKVNVVPDQLLQVFVNILINALDATEGNGKISVKSYQNENNIFVEIEDNGCGIHENILNKIFDPFFTTKDVGKGTGLGLSVSYGIISKFGGKITAESVPDNYSRFIVQLPVDSK